MRVKISVQTPGSDQRETILLSVPKHLKYIIDLQVHIVKKLNLGEKQNQSIYLSVDGYHLPTNEKISELIKEDDLINVGFLGSKRKNKNFLGSSNVDDEEVGEYNEAERDHQFMRLIQEVSILRNLYAKTKKIKMEDIESEEGIVNIREEIVIPKTEHEIVRKNKEVKKAESSVKKQEPIVTVKKAVVKKAPIESSESESESESEEETPRVDVKPKKPQVENKPKAQKIEPAKKKEEVSAKPKTQPVKSKPAAQTAAKKMEEEDESSSEEEEEPQIKEKKITTQLNLPNPTEVFLKKKEEWDKLPISQWGVAQREKIEKKAQAKAAAKKEAQQKPAVTQAPKEESKKNVTTPAAVTTSTVAQTKTSQFTKPVSFVPPGQAKNQTSQQIVIVNKEQTIKVKPPLHQQPKPANNVNSAHNAGYSYNQYNNRQERPYNNTYNNTYNRNEEWPPVKIPVYEPNLLESVPAEDTGKISDVSKAFPDYMEVPVGAINEKWIKDNLMLLHVNDVVKYKCETLSVKTMAPVVSDWRSGTITAIQKNRITIKRSDYVPKEKEEGEDEDEDEEEESEEDELFLHNLKAVCVLKTCLQEDRLKMVKGFMEYEKQKAVTKDDVAEKKRKLQEELEKKMQESEENAIKDARDYKKKMIGKQINYYFSDKNFAKDQFIKAHTEKDPDRYMPINLLLNFPKIRGMSQDLSMILESIKLVLSTESNCTYEIDPTETKIRKRVACIDSMYELVILNRF